MPSSCEQVQIGQTQHHERTRGVRLVARYAPRMVTFKINPEKIRDVIGKGGAVIRALSEETRCQIDIQDDGTITIASPNADDLAECKKRIDGITAEVEVGKVYEGPIIRIMDFGAVIQLLPGRDGLLHISQIANERVNAVTDFFKEGDLVKVKVLGFDDKGRVKLSRKVLLDEQAATDNGGAGNTPQ